MLYSSSTAYVRLHELSLADHGSQLHPFSSLDVYTSLGSKVVCRAI